MYLRGFVQFAAFNDTFRGANYHFIMCFVVHLCCSSICRPIRIVDGFRPSPLRNGLLGDISDPSYIQAVDFTVMLLLNLPCINRVKLTAV